MASCHPVRPSSPMKLCTSFNRDLGMVSMWVEGDTMLRRSAMPLRACDSCVAESCPPRWTFLLGECGSWGWCRAQQ